MTADELHDAYLEADRLRNEPAFQAAVLAIRQNALEALATINPVNIDEMRDAQATVRAIDGLTTEIANTILRWKASRQKQSQ